VQPALIIALFLREVLDTVDELVGAAAVNGGAKTAVDISASAIAYQ